MGPPNGPKCASEQTCGPFRRKHQCRDERSTIQDVCEVLQLSQIVRDKSHESAADHRAEQRALPANDDRRQEVNGQPSVAERLSRDVAIMMSEEDSAARSESRIAIKARPTPERTILHDASMMSPITTRLT